MLKSATKWFLTVCPDVFRCRAKTYLLQFSVDRSSSASMVFYFRMRSLCYAILLFFLKIYVHFYAIRSTCIMCNPGPIYSPFPCAAFYCFSDLRTFRYPAFCYPGHFATLTISLQSFRYPTGSHFATLHFHHPIKYNNYYKHITYIRMKII